MSIFMTFIIALGLFFLTLGSVGGLEYAGFGFGGVPHGEDDSRDLEGKKLAG
jgi:hypothetical protein